MIFEKQVVNEYKKMMFSRCDDVESVKYFSAEDFDGLRVEEYSFKASAGHTLQGYFYEYDNALSNRIIVFDHGFGGGHLAYMKEIELLCRRGFRVFSYDHTGCMKSGGESPNGLAQSLCDLNDCITMLRSDKRFSECDISVMGHSWGGFSTLNITALHPDISHIVVISGFVSVEKMVNTFFGGAMKCYRKAILALEKSANPYFVEFNAMETLKNTTAKALLIYSDNDPLCKREHYDMLNDGLKGNDNVSLMLVADKGHNPNYTEEAVKYLGEFSAARAKLLKRRNLTAEDKKSFVDSFDWNRMTEQDAAVWSAIFAHLES